MQQKCKITNVKSTFLTVNSQYLTQVLENIQEAACSAQSYMLMLQVWGWDGGGLRMWLDTWTSPATGFSIGPKICLLATAKLKVKKDKCEDGRH